jgi:hypothetical protein
MTGADPRPGVRPISPQMLERLYGGVQPQRAPAEPLPTVPRLVAAIGTATLAVGVAAWLLPS